MPMGGPALGVGSGGPWECLLWVSSTLTLAGLCLGCSIVPPEGAGPSCCVQPGVTGEVVTLLGSGRCAVPGSFGAATRLATGSESSIGASVCCLGLSLGESGPTAGVCTCGRGVDAGSGLAGAAASFVAGPLLGRKSGVLIFSYERRRPLVKDSLVRGDANSPKLGRWQSSRRSQASLPRVSTRDVATQCPVSTDAPRCETTALSLHCVSLGTPWLWRVRSIGSLTSIEVFTAFPDL